MNEALTTGQIAKHCQVSIKTVKKWIDTGLLPGHTLPNTNDRRVLKNTLIDFMSKHNLPIPATLTEDNCFPITHNNCLCGTITLDSSVDLSSDLALSAESTKGKILSFNLFHTNEQH